MIRTHNATKAILKALIEGRHISQLDCREFMIEDIRTAVCHLRRRFPSDMILKKSWTISPVTGARLRVYWLENK